MLFFDIETYNDRPLSVGTYAYAETAEVLLVQWAVDDGPVHVHEVLGGELPEELVERLMTDTACIHNSAFERAVLREAYGLVLDPRRVVDTMVLAYEHGLPGGLDVLSDYYGLGDQAKDKAGKQLIRLFCAPYRGKRIRPEDRPDDWPRFVDYARQDIVALRAVYRALPKRNWALLKDAWVLDQRINDRGFAVDLELARAAAKEGERLSKAIDAEVADKTDGAVGTAKQRDALLTFLSLKTGVVLPDLRASTVSELLAADDTPDQVRELLALRAVGARSSTAKYKKILNSVSRDGRIRGALQFCGAARTGRWSGRLMQPQNLPRPMLSYEDILHGVELIKARELDLLDYSMAQQILVDSIRAVIVPSKGNRLIVADLSNIEGRGVAWLCGETWKLDVFRAYDAGSGVDPYVATYAAAFGVKHEAVGSYERQIGKVMELALGYQGGVGAFAAFANAYRVDLEDLADRARLPMDVLEKAGELLRSNKVDTYGLSERAWLTCDGLKQLWRRAHRRVVATWHALSDAFEAAQHGVETEVARCKWGKDGDAVVCVLPSGRALYYHKADGLSYHGQHPITKKIGLIHTHGGKLLENITQAWAADILREAVQRIGDDVVLTVHDEVIVDTARLSLDDIIAALTAPPKWAPDVPLAAKGAVLERYGKA